MDEGGVVQHAPEGALQPVGPFGNAVAGVDEVLADLQERMGEPAPLGMHRDRIAVLVAARIGFVVADREARLLPQRSHERQRQAGVLVPQHADMPGPLKALEHRREAVDREEYRCDPTLGEAVKQALDRPVIGEETGFGPRLPRGRRQRLVGRHRHIVAHRRDRGRVIEPAVAVDDQPRIGREGRWRIEPARERAGELRHADVPGDVAGERGLVQAQPAESGGDGTARMVADE